MMRFLRLFGRAMLLRCPRCGGRGVVHPWARVTDVCPTCDYWFEREEGYWLGAVLLNTSAAVILFAALLVLPVRSDAAVVIRLAPRAVKMVVKPTPRPVVFRSIPIRSVVAAPVACGRHAVKVARTSGMRLAARPLRPAPGRYVWVPGHWAKKPYRVRHWVGGHWKLIR